MLIPPLNQKNGKIWLGVEKVRIKGNHNAKFDKTRDIKDGDIVTLYDALNGMGYWHPKDCAIQCLPIEFMEKVHDI